MSFLYLAIFTLRRYQELLKSHKRSITDALLQTLNRGGGLELLESTLVRQRSDGQSNSLILFDIDNFKSINDEYGHDMGDDALQQTTRNCVALLRSTDHLIRWGGEEFLILCKGTALVEATKLAERLRFKLASTEIKGIGIVTSSFGVAEMESNKPLRDSIKKADVQLYNSTPHGQNCVSST